MQKYKAKTFPKIKSNESQSSKPQSTEEAQKTEKTLPVRTEERGSSQEYLKKSFRE